MNWIEQLFSEKFIESLGWTIIHSLWQGAMVAILLAFVLIALQKNSSKVRYFVSGAALLTLCLCALATFYSVYQIDVPTTADATDAVIVVGEDASGVVRQEASPALWSYRYYVNFFRSYYDRHLPFIVSLWLMGVMVLSLKFLSGFAYTQRLKSYKAFPASDHWHGTLKYLAAQIKVHKTVRLMESALIQVPMVVGYFKPVILLPLGTLTGLSSQQLESILAHELAHIRRHDYLLNILQSLLEILLFFNPFVWWISSKIREERENCCDDLAVEITGDHLVLAKTLAVLEAKRLEVPALALGLTGQKGGLVQRIKRLLYQKTQRSTFSEGFLSAIILIFCLVIATLNAHADYSWKQSNIQSALHNWVGRLYEEAEPLEAPEAPMPLAEPIPARATKTFVPAVKEDTIRFGKDFMIVTDRRGQMHIFKNGKEIPEAEYGKYAKEFKVENSKIKVAPNTPGEVTIQLEEKLIEEEEMEEEIEEEEEEEMEIAIGIEMPEPPEPPEAPDFDFNYEIDEEDGFLRFQINGEEIKIDLPKVKHLDREMREVIEEALESLDDLKIKISMQTNHAREEIQRAHREIERAKQEVLRTKQREIRAEARLRDQEERQKAEAQRRNLSGIIEQMKDDGLIERDAKRVSIKVKNDSIRVQGRSLSGKMLSKYRKLFKEKLHIDMSSGSSWNYSWSDD